MVTGTFCLIGPACVLSECGGQSPGDGVGAGGETQIFSTLYQLLLLILAMSQRKSLSGFTCKKNIAAVERREGGDSTTYLE